MQDRVKNSRLDNFIKGSYQVSKMVILSTVLDRARDQAKATQMAK